MLEGVYVDTIWKHDTIRPYPPQPQEVSGITIGQGAIYRYSLPESDYPTLIIAETIYDDDNNYISVGYYGLALNDEKNFFILIQGGRPIAIFPVFKVEEDANEHARLNDKKYKKELKREKKETAETNKRRDKVGMSPVEDFVYKEASIEYNVKGGYYLVKYQRGTIKAWGAFKK